MQPKLLITVFIAALYSITASAQISNPYNSIGKTGKILTLSKGKYEEQFDADSIQQVGNALINIYSLKIVKLLSDNEAGNKLNNSASSRFLSVDPIGKRYPELTPYQFASNRPIDGVDMDGLEYLQYNIIIDYKTGKTLMATPVWYNPAQHNAHGSFGQGVEYKIMIYDQDLKVNRTTNFVFAPRNAMVDGFGLIKAEYGNYMGATSLYKVGGNGKFTNTYDYDLEPVDHVDFLAKKHDMGYDALRAVGANSLFNDWGTTPVDEAALNGWEVFKNRYKVGDADPYNGQAITKEERSAAGNAITLFRIVFDKKESAIAAWMFANYSKEAKDPFSLKANEDYNYELFKSKYLLKNDKGQYIRNEPMWERDKKGDYVPKKPGK